MNFSRSAKQIFDRLSRLFVNGKLRKKYKISGFTRPVVLRVIKLILFVVKERIFN